MQVTWWLSATLRPLCFNIYPVGKSPTMQLGLVKIYRNNFSPNPQKTFYYFSLWNYCCFRGNGAGEELNLMRVHAGAWRWRSSKTSKACSIPNWGGVGGGQQQSDWEPGITARCWKQKTLSTFFTHFLLYCSVDSLSLSEMRRASYAFFKLCIRQQLFAQHFCWVNE